MTRSRENSKPVYSATSTTRPSNPYEGQIVYETDTKVMSIWDGSAWIKWAGKITTSAAGGATVASHFGNGAYAMAAGTGTTATPGASGSWTTDVTVTLPTDGRFTQTPVIILSQAYNWGNPSIIRLTSQNGTTSFNVSTYQISGATPHSVDFHWLALQMTSGSANG